MRKPTVVKLGSALIAGADGTPRLDVLGAVADLIAGAVGGGDEVCVVSSGAIALGRARAGAGRSPRRSIAALQAASALGQAELQRLWQDAFAPHGLLAAQVLLTAAELGERRSYLNVRNALRALFELGAVPIVNENDTTATDEISFGDNDLLAAHVAVLLRARRLVLLTTVEGVLSEPPGRPASTLIRDGSSAKSAVVGAPSHTGRGGMASKIRAAELAAAGGVAAVITSPPSLPDAFAGGEVGTIFRPAPTSESAFKLWLRYGKRPVAKVEIDDGAVAAIVERGRSLLAVGVVGWTNAFNAGDGLDICSADGATIARGISAIGADELEGRPAGVEVVHRDKLVVL
jgi:glutamate 5-kinase